MLDVCLWQRCSPESVSQLLDTMMIGALSESCGTLNNKVQKMWFLLLFRKRNIFPHPFQKLWKSIWHHYLAVAKHVCCSEKLTSLLKCRWVCRSHSARCLFCFSSLKTGEAVKLWSFPPSVQEVALPSRSSDHFWIHEPQAAWAT